MHIVIDMGGTNTRVAFSDDLVTFSNIDRFPTPQSQEDSHKLFSESLKRNPGDIKSIIFGIAGTVDYRENRIVNAANIKWISDMSAEEITGLAGHEIKSYNDAELAGLAESHQQYANIYENVAYITISTGVGGTIVRNKKADTENYNFEPGHIVIDKSSANDMPMDNIRGSFEDLCSGTAFTKKHNISPADCTDLKLWESYGSDLADGLYTLTLLWQPDAIVIGGSMTNQWDLFYEALVQRLTSYPGYYPQPTILKSQMGDTNGLFGGLKILSSL